MVGPVPLGPVRRTLMSMSMLPRRSPVRLPFLLRDGLNLPGLLASPVGGVRLPGRSPGLLVLVVGADPVPYGWSLPS